MVTAVVYLIGATVLIIFAEAKPEPFALAKPEQDFKDETDENKQPLNEKEHLSPDTNFPVVCLELNKSS